MYPLQSRDGSFLNLGSVINVALSLMEEGVLEDLVTICAFCFRTSAEVMMEQETRA